MMTTVSIKGMSCQHCVASVKKALEEIPGISKVEVDLKKGLVSYNEGVDPDKIKNIIKKLGFKVFA